MSLWNLKRALKAYNHYCTRMYGLFKFDSKCDVVVCLLCDLICYIIKRYINPSILIWNTYV